MSLVRKAAEPMKVGEFYVGRTITDGKLIGGGVDISSTVPRFYGIFGGKRYIFSSAEIEVLYSAKQANDYQ